MNTFNDYAITNTLMRFMAKSSSDRLYFFWNIGFSKLFCSGVEPPPKKEEISGYGNTLFYRSRLDEK